MYLVSMFVNNHTCELVLLFGTNCPYECRNNCQMFAIRRVIFYLFAITFFPAVKLHVFGVLNLCWFIDFYSSWQGQGLYIVITRCEKIIEHTGTPVNIIYYIVALLQYESLWVHFKRNYNLFDQILINVVTFVFFSLYELGHAQVIFESIVITFYCKLDQSLPIFDHMNGSLFDEFTD